MTDHHITDEALAAIKAGLELVQPGPWHYDTGDFWGLFDTHGQSLFYYTIDDDGVHATNYTTAEHITRLDPQTVASLIARLEAAERRIEDLEDSLAAERYGHNL